MNQNQLRIGNFTSSEIGNLMKEGKAKGSFGVPALTYIEEKNMERRLGRALNADISSRPTSWGNLVELMAFNLLGLEYKISSSETIAHPNINFWSGSPDCEKFDEGKTVVDIKCPMTLKSFCQLVDSKTIEDLRENHKEGDKYYWQLISNAVLTGARYAELIVYMPYQDELDAIRELASNYDGNQNRIAWIGFSEDNDLPYLIKGKHYKNINIIRFEVQQADKDALEARILEAGKMLEKSEVKLVKTTDEEMAEIKAEAQEKIKLMKDLKNRMKSKLNAKYDAIEA